MRCAEVRSLMEAFVDGSLGEEQTARIEAHAAGCQMCAQEISLARRLSIALSAPNPLRAPKGFADRVMAGVYRQALRGGSLQVAAASEASAKRRRAPARIYRRMGLSFVVTAAVLAASLLVPRVAYPSLFAARESGLGGTAVVREAMHGADGVVQGILMEQRNGGSAQ
jgi:anti-sigma factor RsiW